MADKIFSKSGTFFILICFVLWSCAELAYQAHPTVGGPCLYKSYSGRATIISIAKSKDHNPSETEHFEVKFSFIPVQKIEEEFARVEGRSFNLYGKNFQYPDRQFLAKNNIHVGAVLEGYVQVIVSGTCTPLLFEFPGIRQED